MPRFAAVAPLHPPADRHVHTEWSWDAAQGDMLATCARAQELGLPAVAFTEHADFTAWVDQGAREGLPGGSSKDAVSGSGALPWQPAVSGEQVEAAGGRRWNWSGGRIAGRRWPVRVPAGAGRRGELDISGYWEAIDRCRAAHPSLRIESGIELGEPHLFPEKVALLLQHRPVDRVLGSLHCLEMEGELVDVSVPEMLDPGNAAQQFRRYLAGVLELVQSPAPFAILAHLDYPKRYWPHEELAFDERDFEDEYRAVLEALARSGRALELNSGRAAGAPRGPCPGPLPLRWWHQAGGQAVSFGSDAHRPGHLAAGLHEAAALAQASGFRPGDHPFDMWGRA